MGKRGGLLLVALLIYVMAEGQNLVLKDTIVLLSIRNHADPGIPLVSFRFTQDLNYSCTFSNILFLNWQQDNSPNQLSLLHQFKYRSQLNSTRNFIISASFVHNLGVQFFFDSVSRFQPDDNTLDTRIEIKLTKNITLSLLSNLATRLFNGYDYSSGQTGDLVKTLNSSFLTPLVCTFSAGFGWTLPGLGAISLGLSSAKLTWIRNKEVYETLNITEFYGVPRDKNYLFEYGLSLHLMVEKNFLNRVQWNCDVLIYKNYEKPMDLVLKNLVGIRINKFLKTSIQTRLLYEEETSKNVQIENIISIGFYFKW